MKSAVISPCFHPCSALNPQNSPRLGASRRSFRGSMSASTVSRQGLIAKDCARRHYGHVPRGLFGRKRPKTSGGSSVLKYVGTSGRFLRPGTFVLSMADHEEGSSHNLDKSKEKRVPVFVMMPLDTFGITDSGIGKIKRLKALSVSLRALKLAGVHGVMVEVWWGVVERVSPLQYDWSVYEDLFKMTCDAGLKLHVVLSFHASLYPFSSPRANISLPLWVVEIGNMNKDIYYRDRHGYPSDEYLSIGVDQIPLFYGRTAVECYEDFMFSFIDRFQTLMGNTIEGITIGLGPSGELRYPAHPFYDGRWKFPGIGEFQCYDKYMMEDLKQTAFQAGKPEWGFTGPQGAGSYNSFPLGEPFFKDGQGTFLSDYGQFFLEWYSGKLVEHADCILSKAVKVLKTHQRDEPDSVLLVAKIAGIHWWYHTESHAAELTAGYYNTAYRNGYDSIVAVFARHGTAINVPCLEMLDSEQPEICHCSPEGLLKQIREVAIQGNIPLTGENAIQRFDKEAFCQIAMNAYQRPQVMRAFTYFRMRETLFRADNWKSFVHFVKLMYSKSHDGGCNGKMYSNLCKAG
ncbi:inactive beta-amylase 4, chloroplastic [Cryptomeria japonica]|uniref:inactive beta-amylase 4, chloroplastic n=1 Tax=Cryptomeria japonica TaxID=3369 RepID=UPI0027DA4056|nr:inactive beta-amylase 4, chloroplastic [Cryptomeria japonica]